MAFDVLAQYATGANPTDLALAQIDAGSQLDLVVVNDSPGQGSVRLGNADGTFNGPQIMGAVATSVAAGDLNGDGVADLATISAATVNLLIGNGDATFRSPQSISLPPQVAPGNPDPTPLPQTLRSVVVGDLNADGHLDLVVGGQTSWSEYYRYLSCGYYGCGYIGWWTTHTNGYVNVLIGNGSGGFLAPVVTPLGSRSPDAIAIGDLNNDGNADVLTGGSSGLSALLGNGSATLAAPIHSGYGTQLKSIPLGDIDGDGYLDALLGWGGSLIVNKGQGNGVFTLLPAVNPGHSVDSAVMGDVNGDGLLDLVAVGVEFTCNDHGYYGCYDGDYAGKASVILGKGGGAFSLPSVFSLGTDLNGAFVDVALADLDGDDLPELLTIERTTGMAIVARNDGEWIEPVALSISNPTVTEGHNGAVTAVFNVTLSSASARDVTVEYATADLNANEAYWYGANAATAGVDYMPADGTLTIPAGQTSWTISVQVIGDRIGEPTELFFLKLSNPTYATIVNSPAIATIVDDEPYVSLRYGESPTVVEGNAGTTPLNFTVELSAASDAPVIVDYSTNDGSAVAGSDYQAASGTVTFAPGETIQTLTVLVIGDTQQEFDEYFSVNLADAANASIGNSYALGYIRDDDTPPTIRIGDASIVEGNSGTKLMAFTVSLSNASSQSVSVNYATANNTAKTSDNDYLAASGTIYFAPGETSKTITVTIKGDTKKENDEKFYVNLSRASGATISNVRGVGTIVNDDGSGKGNGKGGKQSLFASAVDEVLAAQLNSKPKKR